MRRESGRRSERFGCERGAWLHDDTQQTATGNTRQAWADVVPVMRPARRAVGCGGWLCEGRVHTERGLRSIEL